jgi:hypothetical protein
LIGLYWTSAIASGVNIGYRHLLPVVPPTIILIGATGDAISRALRSGDSIVGRSRRAMVGAAAVVGLLIWHAGESLRIAPHYLAYFNPIAGGPQHAYRHLVDSSLDWGQDLMGLKKWLDEHGLQSPGHQPVYLSYFGSARSEYYGIDSKQLPGYFDWWTPRVPEPLAGGVYCISATMLQGLYLMAPRGWPPEYEVKYQSLLKDLRDFDSTGGNERARSALVQQKGEPYWTNVFRTWEQLRFARLVTALRAREPDAEVGYSILIYRLSDADVSRALFGPSP